MILKIRLMNGFNLPKIFSNQLPLIVEKNSLIGKVLVIRMILIFISDPGTPSQRGLNEHSNGLLRKDGLPKMDFNQVNQGFISSVASKETISLENH